MITHTQLLPAWNRLKDLPGGKKLYSFLLGKAVPYTGSISADIEELRPGYCVVKLTDHKKVRNHLNSIHAIALVNLAEVASGLSFLTHLTRSDRAILVGISIDYIKKARGELTATAHADPPSTVEVDVDGKRICPIDVSIKDEVGDVVCKAQARWLVSPNPKSTKL